jgi:hypothetical protein
MEWENTHKEAKKILLMLENQLVELESVCTVVDVLSGGQGETSVLLQTKVANNVHALANLTSKLQSELDQVSLAKREVCAMYGFCCPPLKFFSKLGQLVTDYKAVAESIEKRLHRLQIQQRQEHKQQLHQRAHHQVFVLTAQLRFYFANCS